MARQGSSEEKSVDTSVTLGTYPTGPRRLSRPGQGERATG
jgi:hypothetical protein